MLLLVAAAFVVGCDKEDEGSAEEAASKYAGEKYTGDIVVSGVMMGYPYAGDATEGDVYLDIDGDAVDVTFAEICFTDGLSNYTTAEMPSLDIVLPGISKISDGTYEIDSVTPQMLDGDAYGDDIIKSIEDITITIDGDDVTISFTCTVLIDMMGTGTSSEISFNISFSTAQE